METLIRTTKGKRAGEGDDTTMKERIESEGGTEERREIVVIEDGPCRKVVAMVEKLFLCLFREYDVER